VCDVLEARIEGTKFEVVELDSGGLECEVAIEVVEWPEQRVGSEVFASRAEMIAPLGGTECKPRKMIVFGEKVVGKDAEEGVGGGDMNMCLGHKLEVELRWTHGAPPFEAEEVAAFKSVFADVFDAKMREGKWKVYK